MTTTTFEPFLQRDFLAFEKHRQRDDEFNALRLSIRRKLKRIADRTKALAKEAHGVELAGKEGLHHPYTFNSYRVREQRAYLCRSDKERKKLASYFGEALGKDAETHYIQTVLEVCIDDQVVEAALRIHPQAWWDGQNLKKKVAADKAVEFTAMLNALPKGFFLRVHDWRGVQYAGAAKAPAVAELLAAYTPGDHWLHVVRELPKEDALAMELEAPEWLVQSLLGLLPVYRYTLWEP